MKPLKKQIKKAIKDWETIAYDAFVAIITIKIFILPEDIERWIWISFRIIEISVYLLFAASLLLPTFTSVKRNKTKSSENEEPVSYKIFGYAKSLFLIIMTITFFVNMFLKYVPELLGYVYWLSLGGYIVSYIIAMRDYKELIGKK